MWVRVVFHALISKGIVPEYLLYFIWFIQKIVKTAPLISLLSMGQALSIFG